MEKSTRYKGKRYQRLPLQVPEDLNPDEDETRMNTGFEHMKERWRLHIRVEPTLQKDCVTWLGRDLHKDKLSIPQHS